MDETNLCLGFISLSSRHKNMNLHKYSQFTDTILHTCFYSFHLCFEIKVPRHSVHLYLYLFVYFAISLVSSSCTLLQHATCILPYSLRPLSTLLIRVQKSIQQVRMSQEHKREIKKKKKTCSRVIRILVSTLSSHFFS